MGSLFEMETLLIIIIELKFITKERLETLFDKIEREGKQINSLINRIKQVNK